MPTEQPACKNCGLTGPFYRDEPTGYVEWQTWAEEMALTHIQTPCPGCKRLTQWRRAA